MNCLSSGVPISFNGWPKNSAVLVPCLYTLIIIAVQGVKQ